MSQKSLYDSQWDDIDINAYEWSVRLFRSVKKVLSVNLKLHATDQVEKGDIFLFNHFSRFETFIPQYLIYEKTNRYSCAIASAEFFKKDTALAKYLRHVGVFPHNHPRLFPILAEQVFRGRKVIIFPEGGMVKDRNVVDEQGHYRVFSRISGQKRKHHTGPAVLAQGIETFKAAIRNAYRSKDIERLLTWQQQLKLESLEQLLMAAIKPTLIIPANITFYPIRSSENILHRGAEFFAGDLSLRQTEELLIEGNLILKDTDMDIRMGQSIDAYQGWFRWHHNLVDSITPEFASLDELFAMGQSSGKLKQRFLSWYFKQNAKITRNIYMQEIYANVTINLSHLASTLIMYCIGKGQNEINKCRFYNTLYLAIKLLQDNDRIKLHRSLLNPEQYGDLITCQNPRFEHFICISEQSGLITVEQDIIRFLPKLCQEYDIDSIRMENLIAVYDNEAAPIRPVLATVIKAYKTSDCISQDKIAKWLLDDQIRDLQLSKKIYSDPRYDDINQLETATANAEPFLLKPEKANGCGVLLIHGLLASPAELIEFGKHLCAQGYTVLGVRIKGHGTSPYELKQCAWEDWYESVKKQFHILKLLVPHCFVCGFSTGGALAIKLATDQPENIVGVIAVAVPFRFVDAALMLVPLLHGANKIIDWVSSFEGVKPFIDNIPEHPDVNYHNAPIRALYELRRLVQEMNETLPKLDKPALFVFADQDPVVALDSSEALVERITTSGYSLQIV